MIPFNKPYLTGKETQYITEAVNSGHISGNGIFTKRAHAFFEKRYGFKKALLTTSCTDALEMSALLTNIKPGDEVILPSYTFVSTALAFVRQGARLVFCDSYHDHPNIDPDHIASLMTENTRVIIPVHYAGVACDMDKISRFASSRDIVIVEDAAQAIDSFYKGKPLGSIGSLAAFSFHETKNINSGEGGLLAINDEKFTKRSEILWEKGTNRAEFFRGEVNKYGWVDTGSSFLPSEIIASYLWAQLENIETIQKKRIGIWNKYYSALKSWSEKNGVMLPVIPEYATNNAHMFYMVCRNAEQRAKLIARLKERGILAVFHYLSLHKSEYYRKNYTGKDLPNSDHFTDCLVRLPLYYELSNEQQDHVIDSVLKFN
jgi:dTDP-4-amino-4,6-dideoxygalactose transaminase